MKKIPRVFRMDPNNKARVLEEVTPGCEWVLAGEGIATRKWDGTACLVRNGKLYKRYDAKAGKTPPAGWEPCEPAADPETGHWPGWVPVGDGPEDWMHREVLKRGIAGKMNSTYELIGPKVGKNPEKTETYELILHGLEVMHALRTYEGLRAMLEGAAYEGIVFHHPDGRMAKIRRKDFGFKWPV